MHVAHDGHADAMCPREAIPLSVIENPRETMRGLPAAIQPFLTWLTGMPTIDEKPIVWWTPFGRTVAALAIAMIGMLLTAMCVHIGSWLLVGLPFSWLLTVNGMRDLYTVTEHYCIHNAYSRVPWVDVAVGQIVSTILLAAPVHLFRKDHLTHHAVPRLDNDPDVVFLKSTGFRREMTTREFRSYILRTSLSPVFHARYAWARLTGNLSGPRYRIAMTIIYLTALVTVLTMYGQWFGWAIVWAIPAVLLFQVASLINFHSEHLWDDVSGVGGREAIARVCVGRFCGEPVPDETAVDALRWVILWGIWWWRVFFVHLPYRLLVLPGDQSQHDLHHRRPRSDWANAAFVRRDDVIAGAPGWPVGYIDVWGSVVDHLDACIDPWGSPHIVRHGVRPGSRAISSMTAGN